MMKEKGMDAPMDYTDLNLDEEDDPLPWKFKFPNMRKYSGTDDPHLHLKQYVTYIKVTGLTKAMTQMQMMMKEKGITAPMDYADLTLDEEDDPMPRKFKFLNMKKYSGTDDPHMHLKQYMTYMKATSLSKVQITKQFPISLEGAPIRWYYALNPHVQSD